MSQPAMAAWLRWLEPRFELSREGAQSNLRPMEGLRGLAVFLVFLVHYASLIEPWLQGPTAALARTLHTLGNVGVDLFFVLSGYLIYGTLVTRAQPVLPYMKRRIQRIYPAFTAVFLLYVGLSIALPAESKLPPGATATALYLLQNFLLLPGLFDIPAMITVAWSLSYEMFYYLAVPLIVAGLGLRRQSQGRRAALSLLLAIVAGAICLWLTPHPRLIMFLAGILLFEWLQSPGLLRPGWVAGGIALLLGLASPLLQLSPTLRLLLLFAAFLLLCAACLSGNDNRLTRGFCWTPLRWLGNMSYSYYLIHGLSLKFGFLVLTHLHLPDALKATLFWWLLPLMLALTLLPSTLLFLWVERPYSLAGPLKAGAQH